MSNLFHSVPVQDIDETHDYYILDYLNPINADYRMSPIPPFLLPTTH